MARTTPTPIVPTITGALATPGTPDATGDILPPNGTLVVICGATPSTVTIDTTQTIEGLPLPDAGGVVAANTTRVFKLGPAGLFKQPSDASVGPNQVLVNYSSVATCTRFVIS